MCYGDSVFITCPRCNTTEQIFEQQGVCPFGSSPPETWWILPCVILGEFSLNEPCNSCSHLFNWFDNLASPTSQISLTDSTNGDDSALLKNSNHEDVCNCSYLASVSSEESYTDDPEEHLHLICTWYEDIEHHLNSIRRSIPSIRTRCIATKNVALILKLGLLEASIETTLTESLQQLEYIIELSTWLRLCAGGENDDVEPDDIRSALFEMRMNYCDLCSDEGCADAVTKGFGVAVGEVWGALEAAEEVCRREAVIYGVGLEVPETKEKRKSFVDRVLSMIVA
ncbi:hypothetical protein M436DRAFT_60231 [Aureobasidium namibiae CBS 147.97]|uniref:Uncharacterized protein n=1 Tax=Aureobasidium namibiae CBS 147.97 TaxID=1043004 RepID=A0A074XP84_9PEZI